MLVQLWQKLNFAKLIQIPSSGANFCTNEVNGQKETDLGGKRASKKQESLVRYDRSRIVVVVMSFHHNVQQQSLLAASGHSWPSS